MKNSFWLMCGCAGRSQRARPLARLVVNHRSLLPEVPPEKWRIGPLGQVSLVRSGPRKCTRAGRSDGEEGDLARVLSDGLSKEWHSFASRKGSLMRPTAQGICLRSLSLLLWNQQWLFRPRIDWYLLASSPANGAGEHCAQALAKEKMIVHQGHTERRHG